MATITDANGSSTTLTGTKTNDTIDASGADATMSAQNINSGNANDTIFGGGGDDRINGGAGIDTAVYLATLDSLSASSFSWSGNTLIVRAGTSEGTDQLVNVEYLLFGAKKDESGQFVGDKVSINGAVAKFDTFTVDENPTGPVSMDALANDFSLKAGATLSYMTLDDSRIAQTGEVVAKTADGKVDIVLGSDGKLTFGPLTPATVYDFVALGDTHKTSFTYQVTNGVVDSSGKLLVSTATSALNITGANDAPTLAASATSATLAENQTRTSIELTPSDVDAGTTFTASSFVLTGADASKFTVVEDAGKFYLAFVSAPDFETPGDTGLDNTYDVSVAVKDGTGAGALTSTATALSVSVTNVNEAPTVYTEVDTSTNNNDNAAAADAFALDQNGHATVIGSVKGGNNDYFLFDTDFFTIANATAGQTITLDLHDNVNAKVSLIFKPTTGPEQVVAVDNFDGTADDKFSFLTTQTGTYYAKVETDYQLGISGSTSVNYTLDYWLA